MPADLAPNPIEEEPIERLEVLPPKGRKARQRRALMTVEGGGNPPYAAPALAELRLLGLRVLQEPVRWIGDHSVHGVMRPGRKPLHALGVEELGLAVDEVRAHGDGIPGSKRRYPSVAQAPASPARTSQRPCTSALRRYRTPVRIKR